MNVSATNTYATIWLSLSDEALGRMMSNALTKKSVKMSILSSNTAKVKKNQYGVSIASIVATNPLNPSELSRA